MNGHKKRLSVKIGNSKLGDAPNQDLECSNALKSEEDLQDGHQMTASGATNALLKIMQPALPSIFWSEGNKDEPLS